jgi:hypothetical protein
LSHFSIFLRLFLEMGSHTIWAGLEPRSSQSQAFHVAVITGVSHWRPAELIS